MSRTEAILSCKYFSKTGVAISRSPKKIKVSIKILLTVLLFLGIYSPAILDRVFTSTSNAVLAVFGLIALGGHIAHARDMDLRYLLVFAAPFVPFAIYLLVLDCILLLTGGCSLSVLFANTSEIVVFVLKCFLMFDFFYILGRNFGLSIRDLLECLVIVGVVQTVCVLAAFVFPNIRSLFLSFTISNAPVDGTVRLATIKYSSSRMRLFGFAYNLFDAFGYIAAFLILITLITALSGKKYAYFLAIAMVAMPLLNTRYGLILMAAVAAVVAIFYARTFMLKHIFSIVVCVALLTIVARVVAVFMPDEMIAWLERGFNSVYQFFLNGELTDTFYYLGTMIGFPVDWLIGCGGSPELLHAGTTDVGYVQCVWRYGAIGAVLLFAGFFCPFISMAHHSDEISAVVFAVSSIVIILVYAFKLYPFENVGAFLIIYSILGVYASSKDGFQLTSARPRQKAGEVAHWHYRS